MILIVHHFLVGVFVFFDLQSCPTTFSKSQMLIQESFSFNQFLLIVLWVTMSVLSVTAFATTSAIIASATVWTVKLCAAK